MPNDNKNNVSINNNINGGGSTLPNNTNNSNNNNQNNNINSNNSIVKPTYNNNYDSQYLSYLNNSLENNKNYLTELKDQLKESSYLDLMKSNIAIANAKESALKNTNNYISAMGYGSQGLSQTNLTRNNNAYLNALANNRSDYSTRNTEIDQSYNEGLLNAQNSYDQSYLSYLNTLSERQYNEYLAELQNYYTQQQQQQAWDREDKQNEDLNNLTNKDDLYTDFINYIQNSASYDDAIDWMDKVGTNVNNGVISGGSYDNFTDTQKEQIKYALEFLEKNGTTNNSDITWLIDSETKDVYDFPTQNHNTLPYFYDENGISQYANDEYWASDLSYSMGDMFQNEYNALHDYARDKPLIELANVAIKLTNGKGQSVYCTYDKNGTLKIVPRSFYEKATKTAEVRYNPNAGSNWKGDEINSVIFSGEFGND